MNLSVCSYNVRGLGQKNKRTKIFKFLEKKQINVCFLQETHSKPEVESQWTKECSKYDIHFSGRSSSSGGIGILLDKSLQFTMVYHKEIIPGKIQTLKLNVNDHDIVFINLYGPNNDDPSFFDTLFEFLGQNEDEEFIIGGDFNTVLDPLMDKFGGTVGTHKKCREKIHSITDSFELADIWRTKNPNSRKYTWHSSSNPIIFSRLDYFLVSCTFLNQIGNCKILPGFMSDHSLVQFDIQFNPFERGKGYFKLNNSFILQPEYQEVIRKAINDTVELNIQANPNTLWEIIKGTIRNESIKYAAYQKKEKNKKEKQ